MDASEVGLARKVADVVGEMLVNAGVKRCYGIVGDALNAVTDALRRNGNVDAYALAMPSHVPFHTIKGYTLSIARQVLNGKMNGLIKMTERNIRLHLKPWIKVEHY